MSAFFNTLGHLTSRESSHLYFSNGGSSYTIAGEAQFEATGRAVVVTTMGGAGGAITLMFWGYFDQKHWSMSWIINGLLSGMVRFKNAALEKSHSIHANLSFFFRLQVATCSGANAMDPWVAIFAGILGAIACQVQIILFETVLFIDDPLNASAVHLAAGGAGMIFVAFVANPDYVGEEFAGIFYGGEGKFLGYQIYGLIVYCAWTVATSGAMFFALKKAGWFRISEEEEMHGADITHHGGKAYPLDDAHLTDHNPNSSESSDNDKE